MTDWKTLRRSWLGHETVSRAYHISTMVMYSILSFALFMIVFGLSITNVLLPLGTIAIATSFAISGTVSMIVQSLLFVVIYCPYEVGDRVVIEGVKGDGAMTVKDISVTSSTFEAGDGKRLQVEATGIPLQTRNSNSPSQCESTILLPCFLRTDWTQRVDSEEHHELEAVHLGLFLPEFYDRISNKSLTAACIQGKGRGIHASTAWRLAAGCDDVRR